MPCSPVAGLPLCFNTQPRGGGCIFSMYRIPQISSFNTQPRGGGCGQRRTRINCKSRVSTHSRAEAAASRESYDKVFRIDVSTHSRAEAAAPSYPLYHCATCGVSTHSRAEAAAITFLFNHRKQIVSTHSRAEAAAKNFLICDICCVFQHTAARRRLHTCSKVVPKASTSFNTQPRGGGCCKAPQILPLI